MRALDISIIGNGVGNIYSKSHAFYSCIHNIYLLNIFIQVSFTNPSVVYLCHLLCFQFPFCNIMFFNHLLYHLKYSKVMLRFFKYCLIFSSNLAVYPQNILKFMHRINVCTETHEHQSPGEVLNVQFDISFTKECKTKFITE